MNNHKNGGAVVSLILMMSLTTAAQVDTTLNMNAEFQGVRIIQLSDANKILATPEIREGSSEMMTVKYTTIPTRKNATILPKPIIPAKINMEDKLGYLYRGYLRAGFGVYASPLVDLYYTDGRSKKGAFGLGYHHLSSAGGVAADDSIPDGYSDNSANIWGKKFFRKYALQGSFDWERNVVHRYGFDPEEFKTIQVDSLRQRFNTFGGGISFMTYERDSDEVNYNADIYLRQMGDLYNGKETNVDFRIHGHKPVKTEMYTTDFGIQYNEFHFDGREEGAMPDSVTGLYSLTPKSLDNSIVYAIGQAHTIYENWRLSAGAGLFLDARGEVPTHFYPIAEARYILLDGILMPYAGVRGGLTPTTYYSLTRDNPFIASDVSLRNLNTKSDLYGGVSGSISSAVAFNLSLHHTSYEDFGFYVNRGEVRDSVYLSQVPGNVFDVEYDKLDVVNFRGEINIVPNEKISFMARADYFKYKTSDQQEHPWNQPGLAMTFRAAYNLKDKFLVNADVVYTGERWAKSEVPVVGVEALSDFSTHYKLKGFTDATLRVEYRYNKRLSAWVQFNNMVGGRYQRWNAYRMQRFNAMMGVSYAF